MAHAVEQMMFVGATPWHGLGNQLDEAPTVSEAMTAAGLDWEVGLKDLVTVDGQPVPARATYRKTDDSILGVVGPRYTPLKTAKRSIGSSRFWTLASVRCILPVRSTAVRRFGFLPN